MLKIEGGSGKIRTSLHLPGSKSISNRFLLLREVLKARTEVTNLSSAGDTRILEQSLALIASTDSATIDIGQAGTDMRFLTAYLAATPGTWTLTGTERMKERPVGELVNALRGLGADITCLEKEGFPPLQIRGKKLSGGEVSIAAGISSQFISALLLIAPLLDGPLVVNLKGNVVSRPYITMTTGLLQQFGFNCATAEKRIEVSAKKRKKAVPQFVVESDWSAASYFCALCALAPDMSVELRQFSKKSLQADSVVAELFSTVGIVSTFRSDSVLLQKVPQLKKEVEFDFVNCPDLAQTFAVTCFGLGVGARLTGLQTLRLKETDRIEALHKELVKLGAVVESGEDFILINPHNGINTELNPVIETYDDHRMAMSFAALTPCFRTLMVQDHNVVAKSYPAFWDDLQSLGFSVNLQP